ncbi:MULTISPECIES: AmiS/UreI family transporter [Pseudomonas]|jgi:hypothetical protein|uniref:Transporter n=6 Tax=Pseudomonas TaxID=286 RepID=A0A179RX26_PSEPU|nr:MULTISPECIES: AmiS/UreI family transporter [Pseudomonas]MPT07840.1 transporter [Pseudomonas sp.]AFK66929.1 AmiS/UreI transporter [Pseudomonas putida ND6]AJA16408.1 transporter [Pseudomonas putida S12]ANC80765.1 transporter [Pseudomonas putida B6-2]ANI04014.1 transporter [Pseudomonas putida SJTE-1]
MLYGLVLLYVGAVLFINSIWLMGRITDREVAVINLFVGLLSLLVAVYLIFVVGSAEGIKAGALTLLFAFTYLWVAANQVLQVDGRGLGWFCLFVSVTALVVTVSSIPGAEGLLKVWDVLNWAAWTVLWFSFFLLLALARKIQRLVAAMTLLCAIFTAWVPGLLILWQQMG